MDDFDFLELKKKYWNLYYLDINGEEFLFRELSRKEYKFVIRAFDDESDIEDYICKICVLEPEDYDFEECAAGIPVTLANFILLESGFGKDTGKMTEYINRYRNEMTTFDNQISCIIKEAFPDIDIEEIEDWPMEKAMWYLARAEYIFNELRGESLRVNIGQEASDRQTDENPNRIKNQGNSRPDTSHVPVEKKSVADFNLEGENSSKADFPELAEIERFMKGKAW